MTVREMWRVRWAREAKDWGSDLPPNLPSVEDLLSEGCVRSFRIGQSALPVVTFERAFSSENAAREFVDRIIKNPDTFHACTIEFLNPEE